MNYHEPALRGGSALISALALLIAASIICVGVVLQFARWRQSYGVEAQKTEQRLVQPVKALPNITADEQDRQNADSVPEKQKIEP